MKINDNKPPSLPFQNEVANLGQQLFETMQSAGQDVLEQVQQVANSYDEILGQVMDSFSFPGVSAEDQKAVDDSIMMARLGAPGTKSQALTGKGSQVAGDKQSVKAGEEVQTGEGAKVTEKELSKVDGVIDWNKGYDLLEGEWQLWRFLEVEESHKNRFGEGSVQARGDVLNIHGRLYGLLDASWGKMVAQAGIGAQVAIELVGLHGQIKYDAPQTMLAGHDTSLHAILNGDAFVGAFAEGGILLSVGKETFARIGGEAFAGASASLSGKASIGKFVSADVTGSAYAGAGAKGLVEAGWDKEGNFAVRQGLGAAVGVGAGYDWGVSVNVFEIGETVDDAAGMIMKDPQYVNQLAQELTFDLLSNIAAPFHYVDTMFGELFPREGEPIPQQEPEDPAERIRAKQSGSQGPVA